jgi:cytochrome c5
MPTEDASGTFLPTSLLLAGTAAVAAVILVAAALTVAPRQAGATPQFAQQTGKGCGSCHKNPAGGGPLTGTGAKFKAKGNKL